MSLQQEFSDIQIQPEQLNKLYQSLLIKQKNKIRQRSRSRQNKSKKWIQLQPKTKQIEKKYVSPFILHNYPHYQFSLQYINQPTSKLPVYGKSHIILQTILKNQVVLITGDTGCGKSTQVPRIIYQYLLKSKNNSKILCVQPRRLAALNLQKILEAQIPERQTVSYHIGMKNNIRLTTKILFMTNGIFLQRFIHNIDQLVKQYPFIVLDEVHQRDIDTDFILLGIKCIMRQYPTLRIILMSATIDNKLFRYYFSESQLDSFFEKRNYYLRCLQLEKQKVYNETQLQKMKKQISYQFMNSKNPCPSIQITQKGSFKKEIYYLDTLTKYTSRAINIKWGVMEFNQKVPTVIKECYDIAAAILDDIISQNKIQKRSILVFLPGLLQIQMFCNMINVFFGRKQCQKQFDIIQLHSTTLNQDITKKLHQNNGLKSKLIIATNIAESSITVPRVKYIIDFCMTKQVRFDYKSRLQTLDLIWASQASCNQRAGRTGRVCDGYVFRLVQQKFYESFEKYSTPQIQRCSLDRVVLRIMLLHDYQIKQQTKKTIFKDPAQVLGKAIQPPVLKNIGASITSLIDHGGIEKTTDGWLLTELGRVFVQLPIDISYSRMLIASILFGTFSDILLLVSILSQHKNPFKKQQIQRNYITYWQLLNQADQNQSCDFYSLVNLYRRQYQEKRKLPVEIMNIKFIQIQELKKQLQKRLRKYGLLDMQKQLDGRNDQEYPLRFKITLASSFIQHIMIARMPSYDDKTLKKIHIMSMQDMRSDHTIIINSPVIKKPSTNDQNDNKQLKQFWSQNIRRAFRISGGENCVQLFLTYGLSYIKFTQQKDLKKILFCKYMQDSKKSSIIQDEDREEMSQNLKMNFPTMNISTSATKLWKPEKVMANLGDIQYLNSGNIMDNQKNQRINIDPFSINRIVIVGDSHKNRYLVTDSKMQKSMGSYCRYTCLLPQSRGICPLLYLIFHPYANLKPDKKKYKYQSVYLKRKFYIPLDFSLTNMDVIPLNQLRLTLKYFYSLNKQNNMLYRQFWPKLRATLLKKRALFIDQDRWQQQYLKSKQINSKSMQIQQKNQQKDKQDDVKFMQSIQQTELVSNYFSMEHLQKPEYEQHITLYNKWKKQIIQQIQQIKKYIFNTETIIVCGICGADVCRLRDVGKMQQLPFRSFIPISKSLKMMNFNDMGDYFCSMMISIPLQQNYNVYGCVRQHILAFKIQNQSKYKLTSFSNLKLLYPDNSEQQADFEKLDTKQILIKSEKSLRTKKNMKYKTKCKICNQQFSYLNEMQKHLLQQMHLEMLQQFKLTISQS